MPSQVFQCLEKNLDWHVENNAPYPTHHSHLHSHPPPPSHPPKDT